MSQLLRANRVAGLRKQFQRPFKAHIAGGPGGARAHPVPGRHGAAEWDLFGRHGACLVWEAWSVGGMEPVWCAGAAGRFRQVQAQCTAWLTLDWVQAEFQAALLLDQISSPPLPEAPKAPTPRRSPACPCLVHDGCFWQRDEYLLYMWPHASMPWGTYSPSCAPTLQGTLAGGRL